MKPDPLGRNGLRSDMPVCVDLCQYLGGRRGLAGPAGGYDYLFAAATEATASFAAFVAPSTIVFASGVGAPAYPAPL